MAGFFPIFFKEYWSLGGNINMSTARLGIANAAAGLLVAVAAPVLGAMADRAGTRKRLLLLFAYLGVLMSAAMFWVGQGCWPLAIAVYVLGSVGFSSANVFYDALLPSVAPPDRLERVSSLGYALGYLGGGLLFAANVLMTLLPERFGLPDAGTAVRFSFLSVALWWGGFTFLAARWIPGDDRRQAKTTWRRQIFDGLGTVVATLGNLRRHRTAALFLLAYWCYIDGVDTIVRMAVDYGLSLGFAKTDLIIALLIVQFVGFPAAIVFGRLGERWGPRKAIFLALGMYLFITVWGVTMRHRQEFYILAVMIALVQGGLQALSRSYYTRLIPSGQAAQYFGFYNLLGKFAAIIGPALMAGVGLAARHLLMPAAPTADQAARVADLAARCSLGSLILLFLAGGVLFYFAGETAGRKEGRGGSPPLERRFH